MCKMRQIVGGWGLSVVLKSGRVQAREAHVLGVGNGIPGLEVLIASQNAEKGMNGGCINIDSFVYWRCNLRILSRCSATGLYPQSGSLSLLTAFI